MAACPAVPSSGTGRSTCSKHVRRLELQQGGPEADGHILLRYSTGCPKCLAVWGVHLPLSLLSGKHIMAMTHMCTHNHLSLG